MKKSRLKKKRYLKLWQGSKKFCALKRMNERRRTNNINMNPQAASIICKQKRSQDRRTQRKMKNSRRDFLTARSIVLQTMNNFHIYVFLSYYFQCQKCPATAKKIRPATPTAFRKHEKRAHGKEEHLFKCQWPECIYVRH